MFSNIFVFPPNFTSPYPLLNVLNFFNDSRDSISRWVVETMWEKKELIWQDLHVQLISFQAWSESCMDPACRLAGVQKHLVLPALNLCLVSFSPQQLALQWYCGLVTDCLFRAVLHSFMHCSLCIVIILKRPDKLFGSSHLTFISPDPKYPFRYTLWTPMQILNMNVQHACLLL